LDETERRARLLEGMILGHLSNLTNHVTQKESHQALVALRAKHREVFTRPSLYQGVARLLATYSVRLPARRFILFDLFERVDQFAENLSLFDTPLLPRV